MSKELKNTQVCYGEDVLMMRVNDCLIFGNKDTLQKLVKKLEERTAKVYKKQAPDKLYYFYCGACGEMIDCSSYEDYKSIKSYCGYCGAKLDWSE